MSKPKLLITLWVMLVLSACATTPPNKPLPVTPSVISSKPKVIITSTESTRMKAVGEKDWRPATHQVLKGDTMYSIAFYYGLDYHELAELNGIKDPSVIQVGQILRLFTASSKPASAPELKAEIKPVAIVLKEQPKVVKYGYSDAAMAQIDSVQKMTVSSSLTSVSALPKNVVTGAKSEVPTSKTKGEAKTETPIPVDAPIINTEEDSLQWGLPTSGKITAAFSEAANRKGIDIAGKLGQEILASAPGKVVYSGSGLRGYGKLIIIKHNKTYLSAYAHNDKVLVKEGQTVKRGEKIAEMGKTDTDQVKLHFEVRRLGKPVDPVKYLPKS